MTESESLRFALDELRRTGDSTPLIFCGRVLSRIEVPHFGGGACSRGPIYFLGSPVRPIPSNAAFCTKCDTRLHWWRNCNDDMVLVPSAWTYDDIVRATGCPDEGDTA